MAAYTYFVLTLIFAALWGLIYYFGKEVRREMLFLSVLFMIPMGLTEFLWTVDWWRPETITGTLVGIEDLIFAFTSAGIAGVAYEVIFKKHLVPREKTQLTRKGKMGRFEFLEELLAILKKKEVFLSGLLWSALFFGSLALGMMTYQVWLLSSLGVVGLIFAMRPDLILDSLGSGIIFTLFGMPLYWIGLSFDPGFIQRWWIWDNLSGLLLLGIPIEDIIWFLTAGMVAGPLYEFWMEERLS